MRNPKEIVAVKCEGCFTEWYSPKFRNPYEDVPAYAEYYTEKIEPIMPCVGPSLGEAEEEFISSDLDCLSDRMMVSAKEWKSSKKLFEDSVKLALETGSKYTLETEDCGTIIITPYRRDEMPKVNETQIRLCGPFADLMRQRVESI